MTQTPAAIRPHILVILGSSREHRFRGTVAHWFMRQTEQRTDMTFELVNLRHRRHSHYDRMKSCGDERILLLT